MQLLDYVRLLQRRWAVVAAAPLIAVVAAFLMSPSPQEQRTDPTVSYTATHTLLREVTDPSAVPVSIPRLQLFATTGTVPGRVVARLGLDEDPAVLASQIAVAGDEELGTLTFQVTDPNGERAAILANAFADEVLRYFNEQTETERVAELERLAALRSAQEQGVLDLDQRLRQVPEESAEGALLKAQRDAAIRQYGVTEERYQILLSQEKKGIGYITLQEATPVPVTVGGFQAPDGRGSRMLLAGGLGLLLGLALALAMDRVDTRIHTRRGAERSFRLPVIAEIPKLPRALRGSSHIATHEAPTSAAAEAYRILRLSLQLMPLWVLTPDAPGRERDDDGGRAIPPEAAADPGPRRVILITSAGPGEGKTTTAVNLAACYAEGGRSVLLVDCDFHGGDLHRYFGLDKAPGVRDFLVGAGAPLADYVRETHLRGVRVVAQGSTDGSAQLLGAATELRKQASALADIVIIDAGPLLAINDPAALVPGVDAVVVISRAGRTSAEAAGYTTELLSRVKAPVMGVALTGLTRGSSGTYSVSRPSRGDSVRDHISDVDDAPIWLQPPPAGAPGRDADAL